MLEQRFADLFSDPKLAELMKAAREGHLCVRMEGEFPPEAPVVRDGDRVYLRQHWEIEETIRQGIERLKQMTPPQVSYALSDELLPKQKAAIAAAQNSLALITGGPGTGKTYTARHLIEALQPRRVALAAPTGKAAGNLARATGREVQTLHSLLRRDGWHPADLILVDEASMIDAKLMARLLCSVKEGGRLVLIGDPDQLPPVEAGSIFADMVAVLGSAELKTSMRVEKSDLLELADAIREGRELPPLEWVSDPIDHALEMMGQSFCVLSPTRAGTRALNRALERRASGRVPIIICRNDYQLGLFNGDMGWLDGEVAQFGERCIARFLLPKYDLAYALSVHKSQGSEFDHVLLVLPDECDHFGRELLYTAVTRAKQGLALFGSEEQLSNLMARKCRRLSGLQDRFGCIALPSNSSLETAPNISASSSASPLHLS